MGDRPSIDLTSEEGQDEYEPPDWDEVAEGLKQIREENYTEEERCKAREYLAQIGSDERDGDKAAKPDETD